MGSAGLGLIPQSQKLDSQQIQHREAKDTMKLFQKQ